MRQAEVGELFEALVALQARLRAPGGCPWDREQTHDSLRRYLLEETHEVLDAIDSGDTVNLAEELGDLLLQIVFHAELARESGRFNIGDVIEHVHAKMVRRHPHVFGTSKASTSTEVLTNWEQIKAEERGLKVNTSKVSPDSILDGVPRTLPALLEAQQLTSKAAKVGFDWKNAKDILSKIQEEIAEVNVELDRNERQNIEEEIGDLFFTCVNLARFVGLDAELSLKKSNRKFIKRFHQMERAAAATGRPLASLSSEELEELWVAAKLDNRCP